MSSIVTILTPQYIPMRINKFMSKLSNVVETY